MKKLILVALMLVLSSCSKPKTVMICGDHVCVNKDEAKQYFEENLSLEVQIINKNKENSVDLVQLNLNKKSELKKEISIKRKEKPSFKVKKLSKKEIENIKKSVKVKKIKKENTINEVKKEEKSKKLEIIKKKDKLLKKNTFKKPLTNKIETVDVCTIIENCSIEEISKYLINQGKNRKYPNINIREKRL